MKITKERFFKNYLAIAKICQTIPREFNEDRWYAIVETEFHISSSVSKDIEGDAILGMIYRYDNVPKWGEEYKIVKNAIKYGIILKNSYFDEKNYGVGFTGKENPLQRQDCPILVFLEKPKKALFVAGTFSKTKEHIYIRNGKIIPIYRDLSKAITPQKTPLKPKKDEDMVEFFQNNRTGCLSRVDDYELGYDLEGTTFYTSKEDMKNEENGQNVGDFDTVEGEGYFVQDGYTSEEPESFEDFILNYEAEDSYFGDDKNGHTQYEPEVVGTRESIREMSFVERLTDGEVECYEVVVEWIEIWKENGTFHKVKVSNGNHREDYDSYEILAEV